MRAARLLSAGAAGGGAAETRRVSCFSRGGSRLQNVKNGN
jgi:hypothetical protein